MQGTQAGTIVATTELEPFVQVSIDHELWTVLRVVYYSAGRAVVQLYSPISGNDWDLEVARGDYDEPMWELV